MISVRRGLRADAPRIVEFQICLAQETEHLTLEPEVVAQGVGAVFDDPSKGAYWVAEADGQVVGCLLTVPEWSDWRNGSVWWIHSVYVASSMRRRGVFRAMYAALKQRVETSVDLRGLRLYVEQENESAQNVYRDLGMADVRYRLFEWMRDGW